MVTPTLAGTRPGGAISAAWAVMNHLGVEGYRKLQGLVCETRQQIADAVQGLGFELVGDPKLALIAFYHPNYDTYALLGKMLQRGWVTAGCTEPKALHLMVSPSHAEAKEQYIADLKAAMAEIDGGEAGEQIEVRYN